MLMCPPQDLHGLPGSQNGEQASGHVGENAFLYSDDYQAAGDKLVEAVIEYVQNSTYRDSISAVAVCNEPVYCVFKYCALGPQLHKD